MEFHIYPLQGVNEIKLGMSRFQARRHMPWPAKLFRRGNEVVVSDYFGQADVFFYYDDRGALEAIEFARGCHVLLGTQSLFDLDVEQCLAFLKQLDPDALMDDDGITSHNLSLSIWVPYMTSDDEDDEDDDEVGQIESILIGCQGYYDFLKG